MDFQFFSDYGFWILCFVGVALLMPVLVGRMNGEDDDQEEQDRRMVDDQQHNIYDNHH